MASFIAGSIKQSLIWRQVLLVAAAVLSFATGFHYLMVRPAVTELIEERFRASADGARNRLAKVFGFVEEALLIHRERVRLDDLAFDDSPRFNNRFQPLLRQSTWLSSVLYADDQGREILLLEREGGSWLNRLSGLPGAAGRSQVFNWQDGRVVSEEWRDLGYDPRKRPWYQGALALATEGEVHWTRPYTFFTTKEPGITASTRWVDGAGHTRVLALDVLLKHLSGVSSELEAGRAGMVLFLTEDAQILALPEGREALGGGSLKERLMKPIRESGIPLLTEAHGKWLERGSPEGRTFGVEMDGVTWLARYDRYPMKGTALWMMCLVPRADFAALHAGSIAMLVLLAAGVLTLGLVVAVRLSKRFSAPLESLATESERIGRLDFSDRIELNTRWEEINRLARAQSAMREMLRDATQRLAESNALLERRVDERTKELAEANRELQTITYSLSHDLRAPLRAINAYSLVIEQRCGSVLDADSRAMLGRLHIASERMGELIDGMLELARVSRRTIEPSRVDLSAMVKEILGDLCAGEPARRVQVEAGENILAYADRVLIRSVLVNLLGNAWKYTGKTPEARISFKSRVENGETIYVIGDNGAGFDPSYAGQLFVPFQRLHRDTDFPGTGLGLASAKRIIERHQGRIWAEAQVGQGACFLFTLGIKEPEV